MEKLESLFHLWLPSPLQVFESKLTAQKRLKVYVKRDDLIHHHISGNKYRKLKQHWENFRNGSYNEVIAFGGAFSNLLHTLSFIGHRSGVPMTFYVRGDGPDPNNPTLSTILHNGIRLKFLDRQTYRMKHEAHVLEQLISQHDKPYVIPEGGGGLPAGPGSAEIVEELQEQLASNPNYLVMDLGTGGTFSGVMNAIPADTGLIGIPVLKGMDWQATLNAQLDKDVDTPLPDQVRLIEDYHFGGFAKFNTKLVDFINEFRISYGIPLDPIYTGKMVYGIMNLIKLDFFSKDSTIVWVHSGGLQGIDGFNYRHGNLISP